ncbi:AAA family ATPase [Salipaludibacillus aurantiacus]|uniref:Predicted ATP-dependent endonuclease of the OLD family, contains P-loop ATPase and TOPRIM domains n=1 Tax=Salipaludibacillus aurantiacus TaxID=1601833 RepID=A0A1H9UL07_9BACI|nr:AAA family ATPase [Salipaludibacillus aurantiacus]SES10220.1 Predicted ATP-dependent endonuclease of the OLD family, contains P-loop ATPase and TOPRIM domains [Salipaludibacillus aurantiacus]
MKLKECKIKNFRCLKNFGPVPLYNLTMLIGENDSGKSSVLDALEMALNNLFPNESDFYYIEGIPTEPIQIELKFDVSPSETIDSKFLNSSSDLLYKVTYDKHQTKNEIQGQAYTNELLNQDFSKLKTPELKAILDVLGIVTEGKVNNNQRVELIEQYLNENTLEVEEKWTVAPKEILDIIPRFEKYCSSDYETPEKLIEKTLKDVFKSELYTKNPDTGETIVHESITGFEEKVREKLNEKVGELNGFVNTYNNQISNVSVEPIIDFTNGLKTGKLLLTEDNGGTYYLENKGEGTKKRLFMAILDWDRQIMLESVTKPVIRGYDEPDSNLHYEAQRKMYYSIRDITYQAQSQIQAIVCTHSLTMVDRAPSKIINLIKKNLEGHSNVEYLKSGGDSDIDEFLNSVTSNMGITNSSIFYERCFLLVEGITEENALPILYHKYFNRTLSESGIKIINIEGNGSWYNFVRLMGKNKSKLMLTLLDSDSKEPGTSCSLTLANLRSMGFQEDFIDKNVFYIGSKEFEDSFSSELYLKCLNLHWKKADGSLWTLEEIDLFKAEEKFSDKIVNEAAKLSQIFEPGKKCTKETLAIRMAELIDANDVPQELLVLFEEANRITGIQ